MERDEKLKFSKERREHIFNKCVEYLRKNFEEGDEEYVKEYIRKIEEVKNKVSYPKRQKLTEEEKKKKQIQRCIDYQRNRYNTDEEYRQKILSKRKKVQKEEEEKSIKEMGDELNRII